MSEAPNIDLDDLSRLVYDCINERGPEERQGDRPQPDHRHFDRAHRLRHERHPVLRLRRRPAIRGANRRWLAELLPVRSLLRGGHASGWAGRAVTEVSARPLRVIGYCRVSTAKQSDNGHGLGAQHESLEHFCEQHGYELLTVTTDVVSGTASDRMYGRQVAIAAIESGVADALLVRALDRATRDQEDAARLFKRAERNAWRLMDCDRADSGDPSQRLLADIRIAVAAEERRKISERTKEGLAKARKAGQAPWPATPDRPCRSETDREMRMRESERQA